MTKALVGLGVAVVLLAVWVFFLSPDARIDGPGGVCVPRPVDSAQRAMCDAFRSP